MSGYGVYVWGQEGSIYRGQVRRGLQPTHCTSPGGNTARLHAGSMPALSAHSLLPACPPAPALPRPRSGAAAACTGAA